MAASPLLHLPQGGKLHKIDSAYFTFCASKIFHKSSFQRCESIYPEHRSIFFVPACRKRLYDNRWSRDKKVIIAIRAGAEAPARILCMTEDNSFSDTEVGAADAANVCGIPVIFANFTQYYFRDISNKPHEDGSNLGAGGIALRQQLAVGAADDALHTFTKRPFPYVRSVTS